MKRHPSNPILSPSDIPPSSPELEVIGVLNPGAVFRNGKIHLLLRVAETAVCSEDEVAILQWRSDGGEAVLECRRIPKSDPRLDLRDPRYIRYEGNLCLSSISHFRVAVSENGTDFQIEDTPIFGAHNDYESYGVEDPRITEIDGRLYITYTAVSPDSWCTGMISTSDFEAFESHGIVFPPQNKDVSLFPRKICGRYAALHRPHNFDYGRPSIWYAESPDLIHWGQHQCVLRPRQGQERVGGGPPCIETPEGWLQIYHAADEDQTYRLFTALLDLDSPWKVINQASRPLLSPEADYEKEGFFPNVVFSNGLVTLPDGRVLLYYGAADKTVAVCETSLPELLASLD